MTRSRCAVLALLAALAVGCGDVAPAEEEPRPAVEQLSTGGGLEGGGGGTRGRRAKAEEARDRAWERFLALLEEGRTLEALRVLASLRASSPEFLDDPEKAKAIQRLVAALFEGLDDAEDPAAVADEIGRLLGDPDAAAKARAEAAAIVKRREEMTDRDRGVLARHVDRFHQDGALRRPGDWVDRQLAALAKAPTELVKRAKPLPVPDPDATVERRGRQLEKLKERKVVSLLDHIHGALAWLAQHQGKDGGFSTKRTLARCKYLGHGKPCVAGSGEYPLGTTALATLAFLDFRDQDAKGLFETNLANAVQWLVSQQKKDGSFKGRYSYSTPIAVMALGQAASSSERADVKRAAKKGIDYLYVTRGPAGGYRYRAKQAGDLSVTGWVGQALEAVENAGIEAPQGMRTLMKDFLDSTWIGKERFTYVAGKSERKSLYPAGMLLRMVLDPELEKDTRAAWTKYLKTPPRGGGANVLYHHYYAVRVLLALDGNLPQAWREHLEKMAAEQLTEGDAAGTWKRTARSRWFARGGEVLVTAVHALTLEHALYRR